MTPAAVLANIIEPTYRELLVGKMASPAASVMLLAIGLQESRFTTRRQVNGPARGLWQFEKGGGVAGVLLHPSSLRHARAACMLSGLGHADSSDVYTMIATDDKLACAFARLLLYADPAPLPAITATPGEAWDCYIRNWRPGRPHRHTWDHFHADAVAAVRASLTATEDR